MEPSVVRVETISTSSENTSPSGVSTSTGNFAWGIASSAGPPAPRSDETAGFRPA